MRAGSETSLLPRPMDLAGQDHVAPRREHCNFAPLRQNVVHCFGVDFLSTKDVLGLFQKFDPKEIEWLDDSSCNVVLGDDVVAVNVIKSLAHSDPRASSDEPWTVTKPLQLVVTEHPKRMSKSKTRRAPMKEVHLQIRVATEADRKDPGHSGHIDSVYYAHEKERQALSKQAMELRREKKRARRRMPTGDVETSAGLLQQKASEATSACASISLPTTVSADAAAGAPVSENVPTQTASILQLGFRSLLDPLLFLHAPGGSSASTSKPPAGGGDSACSTPGDLRDMLQRAEAEYAAVQATTTAALHVAGPSSPQPGVALPTTSAPVFETDAGGSATSAGNNGLGRQKRTVTSFRAHRDRTPGDTQKQMPPRGQKRRAIEQEPRAVSSTTEPKRRPKALPEVENFLRTQRVRCQRYVLNRTFRGILYWQQKKDKAEKKEKAERLQRISVRPSHGTEPKCAATTAVGDVAATMEDGDATMTTDVTMNKIVPQVPLVCKDRSPPWEYYMRSNQHFIRQGNFMHTIGWKAAGRNVFTVVPHPNRVDIDRLAKAIRVAKTDIRQMKLKEIADYTKFPVFICPPVGLPQDASGSPPMVLVDSVVTEYKKPLLFDCGSLGLSIPTSELLRSTGAACIECLSREEVSAKPHGCSASPARSSAEPAPEPAPTC